MSYVRRRVTNRTVGRARLRTKRSSLSGARLPKANAARDVLAQGAGMKAGAERGLQEQDAIWRKWLERQSLVPRRPLPFMAAA